MHQDIQCLFSLNIQEARWQMFALILHLFKKSKTQNGNIYLSKPP